MHFSPLWRHRQQRAPRKMFMKNATNIRRAWLTNMKHGVKLSTKCKCLTRMMSNADGLPPRCTWPRIVTRVSYFSCDLISCSHHTTQICNMATDVTKGCALHATQQWVISETLFSVNHWAQNWIHLNLIQQKQTCTNKLRYCKTEMETAYACNPLPSLSIY